MASNAPQWLPGSAFAGISTEKGNVISCFGATFRSEYAGFNHAFREFVRFSFHRCMSLFVLGADIEALQMHREIGIGAVPELEGAFDLVAGRGRDLDPGWIDCHRQRG